MGIITANIPLPEEIKQPEEWQFEKPLVEVSADGIVKGGYKYDLPKIPKRPKITHLSFTKKAEQIQKQAKRFEHAGLIAQALTELLGERAHGLIEMLYKEVSNEGAR